MQNTLKAFTKLGEYPLDLARLIGVEESALLYNLIKIYWYSKFHKSTTGWIWKNECFDKLVNLELILGHATDLSYSINFSKLEEILTPKEFRLPSENPPFKDNKFLGQCERWRAVLKEKNRSKSLKDIYSLFEGKTLEESLLALEYSINNKYIGLHFNEKSKEADRGTGNSGGIGRAGGSKNSGASGDKSHLTRSPGEF